MILMGSVINTHLNNFSAFGHNASGVTWVDNMYFLINFVDVYYIGSAAHLIN